MTTQPGLVAILGSGELSDSMAEAHRTLMARLTEPIIPVFIDTPAGFELNINNINEKAVSYFKRNFGLDLTLASYHTTADSAERVGAAITAIRRANYIFAGPGSPSYGVRMWRDSKIWDAILTRWREGAMLVFASAASLTLGKFTIPVYEIYKCGQDVSWLDGLNLLGVTGLDIAVIPHYNNNSGDQHDTRYCFMGAPRLAALESLLPPDALELGVDEYTGLCLDVVNCSASVFGVGEVTLRHLGHQTTYKKGQTIPLRDITATLDASADAQPIAVPAESEPALAPANSDVATLQSSVETAITAGDLAQAVNGLVSLNLIAGAGLEQGIYNRADLAVQALHHVLPLLTAFANNAQVSASFEIERAKLLDLLIVARAELRQAKQWGAADQIRDNLTALGYVLADSPAGTTWQHT